MLMAYVSKQSGRKTIDECYGRGAPCFFFLRLFSLEQLYASMPAASLTPKLISRGIKVQPRRRKYKIKYCDAITKIPTILGYKEPPVISENVSAKKRYPYR